MSIKPITSDDLNPQHYITTSMDPNLMHESFYISNNLSKLSNNAGKMFINNQFSISQYANTNLNPHKIKVNTEELAQSAPNPSNGNSGKDNERLSKVEKLEADLKEISSLIPS